MWTLFSVEKLWSIITKMIFKITSPSLRSILDNNVTKSNIFRPIFIHLLKNKSSTAENHKNILCIKSQVLMSKYKNYMSKTIFLPYFTILIVFPQIISKNGSFYQLFGSRTRAGYG